MTRLEVEGEVLSYFICGRVTNAHQFEADHSYRETKGHILTLDNDTPPSAGRVVTKLSSHS